MLWLLLSWVCAAYPLPGDEDVARIDVALQEIRTLVREAGNQALTVEVLQRLNELEQRVQRLDSARFAILDHATLIEGETVRCFEGSEPETPPRYWLTVPWEVRGDDGTAPLSRARVDLDLLERAVKDATFTQDKLERIRSAMRGRTLTVAEVRRAMTWFSFGKDKVEVAALLHPHVIDPENWFQVYAGFTFESDKRALRRRVSD
jgi:hypothetical protein